MHLFRYLCADIARCFLFLREMQGNRLYKYEKLRSRIAVDNLFKDGKAFIVYPLRVVFSARRVAEGEYAGCKFLITIPKKKIRHAVDRVLLRRRVREAYRLNRHTFLDKCHEEGVIVEVAFLYLSDRISAYAHIEERIKEALEKMTLKIGEQDRKPEEQ